MSAPESSVAAFREAMSHLAAGVVMVTTQVDGKPWGMTVSACCSVSLDPPTLLVSLGRETASSRAIAATRRFGVSLLGSGSIDAARFGAARGVPKFLDSPVVEGALAHVDCALARSVPVADHELCIGEMRHVLLSPGDEPLVYFDRAYRTLASSPPSDPLYTHW